MRNKQVARWPRQLPRDWKDGNWGDASLPFWKELLGVAIAVVIFMSIPWIVSAFAIIFGSGK